jgi:hypothetical protein
MFRLFLILYSLLFILSTAALPQAFAQDSLPPVLTLQAWKEQQVLEAQNQVLRASARLAHLKNSKHNSTTKESLKIGSNRVKQVEIDPATAAERELRRAQEGLTSAQNYGLDEYIAIYLPTLSDQAEAINTLTNRLSKEELAEIVKGLLKRDSSSDTKRNGALTTASSGLGLRTR